VKEVFEFMCPFIKRSVHSLQASPLARYPIPQRDRDVPEEDVAQEPVTGIHLADRIDQVIPRC